MYINMDQYMYEIYKEAEYCKYNMMYTNTFDDEIFYKNSLNKKLREICVLLQKDSEFPIKPSYENRNIRQQEFTLAELAKYNGISGNPPYVAINGIVYDLRELISWEGGVHFGVSAGVDTTENFMTCHGSSKILDKLPKVGILKI
ncbi:steroid-binding protein [Clostridium estertheticum]|uniref:cytochrome b5 domain-containing protein n=1 Tax=Clostridium estertheticum TaxID=238834 RepID=UPI001CD13AE8|nr:cytochrome b5 domain-containing protein [Clostridium estertheticum]MBZ9687831.1 steroid-binding protein [Clostridium estertheticum]